MNLFDLLSMFETSMSNFESEVRRPGLITIQFLENVHITDS